MTNIKNGNIDFESAIINKLWFNPRTGEIIDHKEMLLRDKHNHTDHADEIGYILIIPNIVAPIYDSRGQYLGWKDSNDKITIN